ncbi:PIN domain-containing protein [Candidatus Poribacteria bacterium]|nr:PIN domain-containing protein [Candidatus Poribacteria bacterium]
MILFDTDICVELLRGNNKVIKKRKEEPDEVSISFMTVGELFYGAEKSNNVDENSKLVEIFLLSINIIYPDYEIMKKFGVLKSSLCKQKIILPDADILIATTCLCKCEKLITGNTRHFNQFENLKIQNWIL